MSNLVIVESPAKAKTIGSFLGSDYTVIASVGHIRDLPEGEFGIEIEEGKFTPKYKISKGHSNVVKQIKDAAKNAKHIYLATDEDREGEAIAFHIATAIGKDPLSLPRIVFHEITKSAIFGALKNPRQLDMQSVNAQQARRLLDRIVGYKLSPLLSTKIQRGLSAGRVQSAALKIIVDREREIRAFVPQSYFVIESVFCTDLPAELLNFEGQKIEKLTITHPERANLIVARLQSAKFVVSGVENKERKTNPQPPFMTSSLQQSASNRLGFNPKKTMKLAQELYEGVQTHEGFTGAITYMRTDSLNIASEALSKARELIEKTFGVAYLPSSPNVYATKSKGAQEAHEAIRPTNLSFTPELAKKFLSRDLARLYELIWTRFVASQMSPSLANLQSVFVEATCADGAKSELRICGKQVLFDGFYKVYGDMDKDVNLPPLHVGEALLLQDIKAVQKTTEPPARYSEAGLVKKLENLGIGRPSTYAPTISLLESRDYVKSEKKVLIPQEISFKMIELLERHFSDIVDSEFTSKMEERLDAVAEASEDWQALLGEFYDPFMKKISEGKQNIKSMKTFELTGETCPECGGNLARKSGRYGEFVACENYPKCKFVKRDVVGDGAGDGAAGVGEKAVPVKTGEACPSCGGDLVERVGRFGKFVACGNYPKCKFVLKNVAKQPAEKVGRSCPSCGKDLVKRVGRRGEFVACSGFPKCRFLENVENEMDNG